MAQDDKNITIKVNKNDVIMADHKTTGMKIKTAAIAQGVEIEKDFSLFEIKNKKLTPVKDDQDITVTKNSEFKAIAPDDNS